MRIVNEQGALAFHEKIQAIPRWHHGEGIVAREPSGSTPDPLAVGAAACRGSTGFRLLAVALQNAALAERQRLSRELHDTICQTLYAIAVGARTARELAELDASNVSEIDHLRQLAEKGISEIRALAFKLRQEPLETEGLVTALTRLVDTLRARHGISAETQLGAEPATTPETRQALFRIAQEALRNVAKHSAAQHVLLRLLTGPDSVTLVIEDDGVGFCPQGSFPGHLGLRSMRERARDAGGKLEVTSRPRTRTQVRATVPLEPPSASAALAGHPGAAAVRTLAR